MRILITNDDGINSDGIRALISYFTNHCEVTVVAPDKEQSATGHSITVHHPIRAEQVNVPGYPIDAWAVSGTPSDCVKLAMQKLMAKPPDLVVSGINRGPNLGTDVLYSGTVSAAIEGAIEGIPALAISLASFELLDFNYAAKFAFDLCNTMLAKKLSPGTLLNVNIPPLSSEEINGISITKLGNRKYNNVFEERKDPRGKTYYWLGGEVCDVDVDDPSTDTAAICRNEISITPIHFDLTDYQLMNSVSHWDLKK